MQTINPFKVRHRHGYFLPHAPRWVRRRGEYQKFRMVTIDTKLNRFAIHTGKEKIWFGSESFGEFDWVKAASSKNWKPLKDLKNLN